MAQKLSDFFKGIQPTQYGFGSNFNFNPTTQTLPYTGQTFPGVTTTKSLAGSVPASFDTTKMTPGTNPEILKLFSTPGGMSKVPTTPAVAPAVAPTVPAQPPAPNPYINPSTGQPYSAQEIVTNLANKLPIGKPPVGDVPGYATDQMLQGPQTEQQVISTATDLNNARNDIITGTTDPYRVNQSGIVYSPAQLQAIRSAYAGIYDPVLKEVFAKLDAKEKERQAEIRKAETVFNTDEAIRQYNATTKLKADTPTVSETNAALEKMIWSWLSGDEAAAMTREEKVSKIMGWGADPKTFGFEFFQQ
jgi:hypothetical protein